MSLEIQPGRVIADKYRVAQVIGQGGMGFVYLVYHLSTEERFALKLLNPALTKTSAAQERFRREARTPARIDSDHVARVVDSGIAEDLGGAPFLVMEYLRGQNFEELSDDLGPLPPEKVLVYLRQVAFALDRAHSIGVVHRDLKPENLFLTHRDDGSPCVKVLDFGIAKLSGATGDLVGIKATATGEVFGTPMYMSPEQCLSQADKISAQTDIWALGLVAFRLLMGDEFWTANTITHVIAQIAYEPIPSATARGATFGPSFDEWLAICCAREPAERYGSALEAVMALADALGLAPEASDPQRPLSAEEAARRAFPSSDSLPGGPSSSLPGGVEALALGEQAPVRASEDLKNSSREAVAHGLKHTSPALTVEPHEVGSPRRARALVLGLAALLGAVGLGWGLSGPGRDGETVSPRSPAAQSSAPTLTTAPAASSASPLAKSSATAAPALSASAAASSSASAMTPGRRRASRPQRRLSRPAAQAKATAGKPPEPAPVDPLGSRR